MRCETRPWVLVASGMSYGVRFDQHHPYIPYGSYGHATATCPLPG